MMDEKKGLRPQGLHGVSASAGWSVPATPAQREAHECRCGLRDKRAQQEQNR